MKRKITILFLIFFLSTILLLTQAAYAQSETSTKWKVVLGGQADEICGGMIQSADSCYVVTGGTKSKSNGGYDVYIAKVSRSGKLLWERSHGGSGEDVGVSIRQTEDRGYIIAGRSETRSMGKFDAFLMKTDSVGNVKWKRNFGGAENDYGTVVIPSYEGGYYLGGATESKGAGRSDVFLVRADSSGKPVWEKTFGGADDDYALSVFQSKELNLMIVGGTRSKGTGGIDAYVVRTDNYGRLLWDNTYGTRGDDYARAVLQSPDGNYILLVSRALYPGGDSGDVALMKIDRAGRMVWEKAYENLNKDAAQAFTFTNEGNIAILADDDVTDGAASANATVLFTDSRGSYLNEAVQLDIENQSAAAIVSEYDGLVIAGTVKDGDSFGIYITKIGKNGENE